MELPLSKQHFFLKHVTADKGPHMRQINVDVYEK